MSEPAFDLSSLTKVQYMTAMVRAEPFDSVVRAALVDALMEAGKGRVGAARHANKVARLRAGVVVGHVARRLLAAKGRAGVAARVAVRTAADPARVSIHGATPVAVELGGCLPRIDGRAAYSTFRGGGTCHSPGAAIRRGYALDYHRSTLRVVVGAQWVADHVPGYSAFFEKDRSPAARLARLRKQVAECSTDPEFVRWPESGLGPFEAGQPVKQAFLVVWWLSEIRRLSGE